MEIKKKLKLKKKWKFIKFQHLDFYFLLKFLIFKITKKKSEILEL